MLFGTNTATNKLVVWASAHEEVDSKEKKKNTEMSHIHTKSVESMLTTIVA